MESRPHIQHIFERSFVGGGDKVLGPLQGLRFVNFMIHNYFIDQSLKSGNIFCYIVQNHKNSFIWVIRQLVVAWHVHHHIIMFIYMI